MARGPRRASRVPCARMHSTLAIALASGLAPQRLLCVAFAISVASLAWPLELSFFIGQRSRSAFLARCHCQFPCAAASWQGAAFSAHRPSKRKASSGRLSTVFLSALATDDVIDFPDKKSVLAEVRKALMVGSDGNALEIGSSFYGIHAKHFAEAFPGMHWQPCIYDPFGDGENDGIAGDADVGEDKADSGIASPVVFDSDTDWEAWPEVVRQRSGTFEFVYYASAAHMSPWEATCGLLQGASRALRNNGRMIVHGPFKLSGEFMTASAEEFDASLRARNPTWGFHDAGEVEAGLLRLGMQMVQRRDMPNGNILMHFCKKPSSTPPKPTPNPKTRTL